MASGVVHSWDGRTGWIKQSGVSDLHTVDANDVMVRSKDVVSGEVVNGSSVTFDLDTATEYERPWLATNVAVV